MPGAPCGVDRGQGPAGPTTRQKGGVTVLEAEAPGRKKPIVSQDTQGPLGLVGREYSVVQWATPVTRPACTSRFQGAATFRQSLRACVAKKVPVGGKGIGPIIDPCDGCVVAADAEEAMGTISALDITAAAPIPSAQRPSLVFLVTFLELE
jgi:hypothetical protein